MPIATIVGLLCATIALVLYSIGVWSAFRKKEYTGKALLLLDFGVVMDIAATLAMASTVGWALKVDTPIWAVKTTLALLGMAGMIAVTITGYLAKSKGNGQLMASLSRWALAPWALWAFVYLWGFTRIGLK